MLPTEFQVNWLFGSGGEAKDFQTLCFPIETILRISDLQVILMLPTKLQVNGRFGSGKEAEYRFSISDWNSDRNGFSYFGSSKQVREKTRKLNNYNSRPYSDTKRKRKQKKPNKRKSKKRTKSTKIISLFSKRGNRNAKGTKKHQEQNNTRQDLNRITS